MIMKKYRVGIVGTGGIAHAHIQGYRSVANDICEVVAACDANQRVLNEYCSKYDIPYHFTNAIDLIESGKVDVISLLTPPSVRSDIIFPAFDNGIHILVEKPFAECLSDAISFVEAAEKAGVGLAVNQSLRFMPDVLKMRELVKAGKIGQIRFISHDHYQNRTQTKGWRKDEKRLEISIFSIHILDRIRWLVGSKPKKVSAVTRYWDDNVKGETFTSLTIQFENGVIGTMVSNWHSVIPDCRFRIDGTKGSILSEKKAVTGDESTLTIKYTNKEAEKYSFNRRNAAKMNMGESMKELLSALNENRQPHNSGRDNLQTMAIVDAAYLSSSRDGYLINIKELGLNKALL
ncbi:gfo/Idh/MocA family oxidoreductase [Candidatus Poribacteria bacterium]|nr:gfo/Idh/MocA family oxidoreductase [Candidatus Poribacteria bacterium]